MDHPIILYSSTDLKSYNPPHELLFGKLKATSEFLSLETLGEKTSSSVRKAKDIQLGTTVAIKRLKSSKGCFNEDIFREITILKSLDHDNVIKIIELAASPDLDLYMILEFCPYSLDKYIDTFEDANKPIPHGQLKSVARQMFKGLNYLHNNYIIHRDLKTPNLMITAGGILKIIDFGHSKRLILNNNKPMSPYKMTLWYQPPEVLFEGPRYGIEVDLWSAGCVLGELFKTKPILQGHNQFDQISKIVDLIGRPTETVWSDFKLCKFAGIKNLKNQPFNNLKAHFPELGSTEAMDLLSKLIVYCPKRRISAEDCISHDWFEQAPFPGTVIEIPEVLTKIMPSLSTERMKEIGH